MGLIEAMTGASRAIAQRSRLLDADAAVAADDAGAVPKEKPVPAAAVDAADAGLLLKLNPPPLAGAGTEAALKLSPVLAAAELAPNPKLNDAPEAALLAG